jgi:MFS family permease
MSQQRARTRSAGAPIAPGSTGFSDAYARYVLCVLVLVYVVNFVDRQILAVLAESIKADLHISDADLGFLFGAAFAVFYAVMGLPLARLADVWNRKSLIAIGLAFWSLMTALSGLARGFLPLAACRFGVGVGEASASPAAYSLLYDYFPRRVRTTVLAIYSGGVFIGQGIGIFLGGLLLHAWLRLYPDPATAPFGLKGWQVAFFLVGIPGLLLALWVSTLREPVRGQLDRVAAPRHPHPFREAAGLLAAMLPPTSFYLLARRGGWRPVAVNIGCGLLIALAAGLLVEHTGDHAQWIGLGIGLYAVTCWKQTLSLHDPVSSRLIFRNRTLMFTVAGAAGTNFMLNSFGYWSIPYYQRHFHLQSAQVGWMFGVATACMGLLGVAAGGFISDRLRARFVAGKLIVVLTSLLGSMLAASVLLAASTLTVAYIGSLLLLLFSSAGLGPSVSTLNDMVLPRMRATASAFGFMVTYLVAGAVGPYAIGKMSDAFADAR